MYGTVTEFPKMCYDVRFLQIGSHLICDELSIRVIE